MRGLQLLIAISILSTAMLAADSPFVGTWKFNVAKSKYGGGPLPEVKEATTVVAVVDGQFTVTFTGTAVDGSPVSMKYTIPTTGGPVKFLEGGPPAGSGITATLKKRKADSNSVDTVDAKDGKVYETGHMVISADGKSIHSIAKGVDPNGKKYVNIEVSDKQ